MFCSNTIQSWIRGLFFHRIKWNAQLRNQAKERRENISRKNKLFNLPEIMFVTFDILWLSVCVNNILCTHSYYSVSQSKWTNLSWRTRRQDKRQPLTCILKILSFFIVIFQVLLGIELRNNYFKLNASYSSTLLNFSDRTRTGFFRIDDDDLSVRMLL